MICQQYLPRIKVDLGKIAILPLAEQYLAYIQSARKIDLEIAADYLVMVSGEGITELEIVARA